MGDDKTSKVAALKDKVEDFAWNVRHSRLVNRADDIRWSVQESIENGFSGWCDSDIVNLGDRLCERMAEMLTYLAACEYPEENVDYAEHLLSAAKCVYAYTEVMDSLSFIGRIEGIGEKGHPYDPKVVKDAYADAKTEFLKQWDWIGDNIVGTGFIMPANHGENASEPDFHVKSYYTGIIAAAGKRARAIRDAAERTASENRFSKRDIDNMPYSEQARTASILYEFARASHGMPEGYYGSGSELKQRDVEWLDHQALAASIMGNKEVAEAIVHEPLENGSIGIMKNSKDPDWAAWIEDITYAADVISSWREWSEPGGLKEKMVSCGIADELIDELDEKQYDAFKKAWHWIGVNVGGLWV